MEIETAAEEVEIIQKAPMVNIAVEAKVGEELRRGVPGTRCRWRRATTRALPRLTAGVARQRSGNPQIRGGTYFRNSYTVDGFNTTGSGDAHLRHELQLQPMANVEVTTAGSAPRPNACGGVINVVTKSGSNRFEAARFSYSDQHCSCSRTPTTAAAATVWPSEPVVGGPIQRDASGTRLGPAAPTALHAASIPTSATTPAFTSTLLSGGQTHLAGHAPEPVRAADIASPLSSTMSSRAT